MKVNVSSLASCRSLFLSPTISATETTESDKIESVRPPEILCQVFQLAIGSDGIKALLPLTHVCARWRRTAFGDPSLWTTIYSSQMSGPLLDMVVEHAGSQLFRVFVDHHGIFGLVQVLQLIDRIEEFHYSSMLHLLPLLLRSFGPAPNLKVLHLRPEPAAGPGESQLGIDLPVIFSGSLPSLRDLVLTGTVAWPTGLFGGLISFECGVLDHYPISPVHVLDVLRESPMLEVLRLVGSCKPPQQPGSPAVTLSSLRRCTLIGHGTTTLIRLITVPASAGVFLGQTNPYDRSYLPSFDDLSLASGLHVFDDVSAVSISIYDHVVRLQVKNNHGGILDAEESGLHDLSRDPPIFVYFLQGVFECRNICPGLETTKKFTLHVERGGIWDDSEAVTYCCIVFTQFFFRTASIERMKLSGLPKVELAFILAFLSTSTSAVTHSHSSPNLKRLRIETTPLHSPKLLLEDLDKLFRRRKELGVPFQSVKVKVKCELLIPAADHSAYLSSWEDLVGEGVRLEYERAKVEELPKYRRRDYAGGGEGGNDEDEDGDGDGDGDERDCEEDGEGEGEGDEEEEEDEKGDEDKGREGGEDGGREPGGGDPGDGCAGWEGWPGQWPTTVKEMRGQ